MAFTLQNIFRRTHGYSQLIRSFSTSTATITPDQVIQTEKVNESDPKARKLKIRQLSDRYPGLKPVDVPQKLIDLSMEEIQSLESELKTEFGFIKEEIRFVMRHKPSFILWKQTQKTGMNTLKDFFVKKYGFDIELVRTLVVKYPFILSKTEEHLESVFSTLEKQGVSKLESIKLIFECPKLVSVDLDKSISETFTLFELYHKIKQQEVMDIFRNFPYLFCCDLTKMRILLAQFRKYRFTNDQILHLVSNLLSCNLCQCKYSNGVLASKVSNFQGFFDYLKHHHDIKASDVIKILDTYPELVMQNRRDLLKKKFDLIQANSPNRSDTYIRNLFKRHPDLFLKSLASMEAKVSYIKRNLNRQLQKEQAFPLLLHYSYSQVIWPRCELLLAQGNKHFELAEALSGSNEDFCKKFGIDVETLNKKISSRKQKEERDKLWVYVPAI